MAPRSSKSTGLDLEDFRRLGVRPHEFRLAVIRRAAIRSAQSLAELQMTAPTPQTEIQLARVATSTYRLLDPRQRRQTAHRAYVGRILPQDLHGAGQTNFHNELSDFGSSAGEIAKLPFERSSLSDAALIDLLDLDSSPKQKHDATRDWANSLSDADLLHSSRLFRRVMGRQARSRFPWLALAASGLVFGASLSFALHRLLAPNAAFVGRTVSDLVTPLQAVRTTQAQAIAPLVVANPGQTASPEQVAASQASVPRTERVATPEEILGIEMQKLSGVGDPANVTLHSEQTVAGSNHAEGSIDDLAQSNGQAIASPRAGSVDRASLDPSDHEQSIREPLIPESSFPESLIVGEPSDTASQPTPAAISDVEDSTAPLVLEPPSTLPDPFPAEAELPGSSGEAFDPSNNPKGFGFVDLSISRLGIPLRLTIPSEAMMRTSRRELAELMPQLEWKIEADSARARIKELELIEGGYKPGSSEHWVVRTLIAEAAWLVEPAAQVEERLNPLLTLYDVSPQQLLAETFVGSSRHATLPETRDHLMSAGLRLADELLLESAPAACDQVVEALVPFVSKVPGQDDHLRQYLKDFSDAAVIMTRHADVVDRVRGQSGQPSAADVKVLGLHYCLMLRRWDEGLTWLSDASDRRVARIARQELQLGETPTADALKDVGEQWLAAASRSDGRSADSMRLHAIDLLRRAQPTAKALTKLEIDRMIDDATLQIPPHLAPLPENQVGSNRQGQPRRRFPASSVPLF